MSEPVEIATPLADEPFVPDVISSEVAWRGRVWDVRLDRFRYRHEALTRHFQDHPGSVAVLALDDDDRACLIQQYRHPIRSRDWEIPAGLLDVAGESALAGARRELAEEADLTAVHWHVLADYASSPGGSNERVRIYLARGLSPSRDRYERTGEEADLVRRWVCLDVAVEAVRAGRVQNAISVVALLSAHVERARGWTGLRGPDSPWAHPGVEP